METSIRPRFGGATVLSIVSNSRLNVLAGQAESFNSPGNENVNPRPSDRIPPHQQAVDFFAREHTCEQVVLALTNGPDDVATAMLDFMERNTRGMGVVAYSCDLVRFLLFDFGWKVTNVVFRTEFGEPEIFSIQRPTRTVEDRARAKSKARRARGVESPFPRTLWEDQVDFVIQQGPEVMEYALKNAPKPFVKVALERVEKLVERHMVSYWSPVTRLLLDKFNWTIRPRDGSVHAGEGDQEQDGLIWIVPPPRPDMRQRSEQPPPTFRMAMAALSNN